ncbi:hypothetical protein LTR17_013289 [Elasticomyces elasticus]|nr:hypothetical protein LTR17_013289 [Elasticomyces elasticus]
MADSPLLSLCPELRNRICEFVLRQEDPIPIRNDSHASAYGMISRPCSYYNAVHLTSLTMTCKILHTEAGPMFYFLNTFVFKCTHVHMEAEVRDTLAKTELFLQQIGPANQAALRTARFEFSKFRFLSLPIPRLPFIELMRLARENRQIKNFQCVATFLLIHASETEQEETIELGFEGLLHEILRRQEQDEELDLLMWRKCELGEELNQAQIEWSAEIAKEQFAEGRFSEVDSTLQEGSGLVGQTDFWPLHESEAVDVSEADDDSEVDDE